MTNRFELAGVVERVRPGKREIRIKPEAGRRADVMAAEWLYVGGDAKGPKRCRVETTREDGEDVKVTFTAGVSKDWMATLKSVEVFMLEADINHESALLDVAALVGMRVVTEAGDDLGEVAEVIDTPANAVLEIIKPTGGTLLLPVLEQVILEVDEAAEAVIVGDIEPYAVDGEVEPPSATA